MKRTLIIIFILISILSSSITATSEAYIPSEINFTWEAEQTILQNKIIEYQQIQSAAHQMANAARALGYEENHTVILLAKQEWHEAQNIIHECKAQLDKWQTIKETALQQFEEYPVATTIWYYLKDLGYNDYVCAGILGNIMAEVGGQTLNIQHWLGGSGYYGMCQWSRKFHSGAQGLDLNGQLNYLQDTIKYEIDTFGFVYSKNFNYDKFIELTNEKEAALAFAKTYERCNSKYYKVRQTNATKALEYFTT